MSSVKTSTSIPAPSPPTKPSSSSISEMLAPSEIELLRQEMSEALAFGRKAFAARKAEPAVPENPARTSKVA